MIHDDGIFIWSIRTVFIFCILYKLKMCVRAGKWAISIKFKLSISSESENQFYCVRTTLIFLWLWWRRNVLFFSFSYEFALKLKWKKKEKEKRLIVTMTYSQLHRLQKLCETTALDWISHTMKWWSQFSRLLLFMFFA